MIEDTKKFIKHYGIALTGMPHLFKTLTDKPEFSQNKEQIVDDHLPEALRILRQGTLGTAAFMLSLWLFYGWGSAFLIIFCVLCVGGVAFNSVMQQIQSPDFYKLNHELKNDPAGIISLGANYLAISAFLTSLILAYLTTNFSFWCMAIVTLFAVGFFFAGDFFEVKYQVRKCSFNCFKDEIMEKINKADTEESK